MITINDKYRIDIDRYEEYMKNPEKYWNNLLEKLDEIKQYLKND